MWSRTHATFDNAQYHTGLEWAVIRQEQRSYHVQYDTGLLRRKRENSLSSLPSTLAESPIVRVEMRQGHLQRIVSL